tara:strand:- start:6972 stop:7385 length:414 start_codon:yes stop_codon:yes gene_type:complete
MKKKDDWATTFHVFLEENKDRPFQWGKWDCCLFANAGIKAMTGEDLIPKSLKWKDEKTALVAINKYGGDLQKSIAKACKAKKVPTIDKMFATTGDLVVFKEDNPLVGLHTGYGVVAPGEEGTTYKDVEILEVYRINA